MNKNLIAVIIILCCGFGSWVYAAWDLSRCEVEGCHKRKQIGFEMCEGHRTGWLPIPGVTTTESTTRETTTTEATTEVTTCEFVFDPEVFTGLSPEEQESYVDEYLKSLERKAMAEKATETTTYRYYYNYNKNYSYYFNERELDMGKVHEFYEEHKSEFRCFEDAYEAYEDDLDYWEDYYD